VIHERSSVQRAAANWYVDSEPDEVPAAIALASLPSRVWSRVTVCSAQAQLAADQGPVEVAGLGVDRVGVVGAVAFGLCAGTTVGVVGAVAFGLCAGTTVGVVGAVAFGLCAGATDGAEAAVDVVSRRIGEPALETEQAAKHAPVTKAAVISPTRRRL
jgi:hypothetical protein